MIPPFPHSRGESVITAPREAVATAACPCFLPHGRRPNDRVPARFGSQSRVVSLLSIAFYNAHRSFLRRRLSILWLAVLCGAAIPSLGLAAVNFPAQAQSGGNLKPVSCWRLAFKQSLGTHVETASPRVLFGVSCGLVLLGLLVLLLLNRENRRVAKPRLSKPAHPHRAVAKLSAAAAAATPLNPWEESLTDLRHEILNPLGGVIGLAQSLATNGLDPENKRKVHLLRQCAEHLSGLLDGVLDLPNGAPGDPQLPPACFDLATLVEAVAAMATMQCPRRPGPIEIAISPGVPRYLRGDAVRLRQILLNLVGNALKYSDHGLVTVTIWCRSRSPDARHDVVFAIADEGPGINEAEQERVFERHFRTEAARAGPVPGSGLGLTLCRKLSARIDGRLWYESLPGRGSCFYLEAPYEAAPHAPPSVATRRGEAEVSFRPRALVLDDCEYNRLLLVEQLTTLGYQVWETGSGEQGVALAAEMDFDVVTLDYDLSRCRGPEIVRRLRALANKSAAARLLAISADNSATTRQEWRAAGMSGFIDKPVTLERLRRALETGCPALGSTPPGEDQTGLAWLQALARRKQVRPEVEIALCLGELEEEWSGLEEALQAKNNIGATRYAHLLCGRCCFLGEPALAGLLRSLGEAVQREEWLLADRLLQELTPLVGNLRLRLKAAGPVAPPA